MVGTPGKLGKTGCGGLRESLMSKALVAAVGDASTNDSPLTKVLSGLVKNGF